MQSGFKNACLIIPCIGEKINEQTTTTKQNKQHKETNKK